MSAATLPRHSGRKYSDGGGGDRRSDQLPIGAVSYNPAGGASKDVSSGGGMSKSISEELLSSRTHRHQQQSQQVALGARGERRTKRLSAPVVGPVGGGAGGVSVAPLARQESLEAPFEEDPHRFHAVTKHLLMDDDAKVISFSMPDSSSEQLSHEGKCELSPSHSSGSQQYCCQRRLFVNELTLFVRRQVRHVTCRAQRVPSPRPSNSSKTSSQVSTTSARTCCTRARTCCQLARHAFRVMATRNLYSC